MLWIGGFQTNIFPKRLRVLFQSIKYHTSMSKHVSYDVYSESMYSHDIHSVHYIHSTHALVKKLKKKPCTMDRKNPSINDPVSHRCSLSVYGQKKSEKGGFRFIRSLPGCIFVCNGQFLQAEVCLSPVAQQSYESAYFICV